jgi:hypothetical protein
MAEIRKMARQLENLGKVNGTCIELSEYGVTYMDCYGQCVTYTKEELFDEMSKAA